MNRRSTSRFVAIVAVVVAAVLAWLFTRETPTIAPPVPTPAVAPAPPRASGLRSAAGTVLPNAVLTVTEGEPRRCVRGRVVDAVTNRGVPRAQVTLATSRGALQATADDAGAFSFFPEDADVAALAEVSAAGYFAYRPAWGHFPLSMSLQPGKCVTELVLSLVPRIEYRGLVVGPDDEPVAGASVTIATGDEPPDAPILTGSDGKFTFNATDGAQVVARHERFAPGSAVVDFRVGVTRQLVLKLGVKIADAGVERARLTGVVLDSADAGIAGAQVKAMRAVSAQSGLRLEGSTETDHEGHFSLEVEGPGPWKLFAHVPGVLSDPVTTMGEPVVIRVTAGAELGGTVRDQAGRVVQSFSVMITSRREAFAFEPEDVRHFVDALGAFSIKGLAPGPVRVVVVAAGFAPSEPVDVELSLSTRATVSVTLHAGAQITGQVVDRKSRAPLEGARLSLEGHEDSTLAALPSARTDADGGFALVGISPGRRSIFVVAEQHHARLVSVEAREGEATPVLIDLGAIEKDEDPRLELVGIGAILSAKGDVLEITQTVPGGGAAEVGLVAGDGVVSIDGELAAQLGFAGSIERIRGPEGSYVKLEVRRVDGSVAVVDVPRRRIESPK